MTRRTDRVADAIQSTIAQLLLKDIKDPRIGMVTLTSVRVSPDLRHARVLFSVFGDDKQRERSLAGLRSATGYIRTKLARGLRLRSAPEIVFEFDPSFRDADRVNAILKEIPGDESEE